jgi:OmpA-OmpF porin, OOP family
VLPHHDEQASDDKNQAEQWRITSFEHASAEFHLLISVTFSTPTGLNVDYLREALELPRCLSTSSVDSGYTPDANLVWVWREALDMSGYNRFKITYLCVFSLVVFALSTSSAADTTKVEGLIKARDGDTIILETPQAPNLVVLLSDDTEVGQVQGVLKARRKNMSMAALIPGLKVKVEGTYNSQNQLVAKLVKFKGNDLEEAQTIQAGMHESQEKLKQQQAELEKHYDALQAQQAQLTEHQAKIAANKASIEAAVARFGQLDDYYIFDELPIYFGNGKVKVDPKYTPQLLALADKAKNIEGFMIEVKGYASSLGSTALNQKLSEDRASNVTQILLQQAHVPLTRMLAPGAMGESHQVGNDKTAEGQAENRRVVVRVLQNKAIAGI